MTDYDGTLPDDQAAADRLDAQIDSLLAGRSSASNPDPDLLVFLNGLHPDPSASTYRAVADRVRARPTRRWGWAQAAAALLGVLFLAHGFGNIVAGQWISTSLGEPYNEHGMIDGGLAFLGVGAAVLVAAARRRWLPVAVIAGVPFGLILAGRGAHEWGTFAWGAVLHTATGVAAVVLLVTFVLAWRYGRGPTRE